MRTDPTDNGGLFIGRRPGTAPVRYRTPPRPGSAGRRTFDRVFAATLLGLMGSVAVLFWGPIPMAWLWIGAQIQYRSGSIELSIGVAFLGMMLTLLAGLVAMRALDHFWILVRRASGHDQRKGVIGPVFGVAAVVGVVLFSIWLLFIAGLSPTLAPTQ